jgi:hypothetical protein
MRQDVDLTSDFHSGTTDASNAVGYVGAALNITIATPPYFVTRCDQVLQATIQRITDMNDYCKKQDAFMTMSTYMINLFESKDSSKLLLSLNLSRLNVPEKLPGAPGCIGLTTPWVKLGVCFTTPDVATQFIVAFDSFTKCRLGNLKNDTITSLTNCTSTPVNISLYNF